MSLPASLWIPQIPWPTESTQSVTPTGSPEIRISGDFIGYLATMPPSESQPRSVLSLTEVRLERFKAAFKPDPIHLGGFNVVIGRNGTGKSTLLEALQWLDGTIRQDARTASERYHGVHDLINLRSRTKIPCGATIRMRSRRQSG